MSAGPTLLELQHDLERLFALGGEPGYEARLAEGALSLPVGGDDRLNPAARLEIYTSMIYVRIRDAIAEDFPATYAALGDEAWDDQMRAYLAEHPTDHPDLRMAGRHLPAFLRHTAAAPVADLADLEWALLDSFTSADTPVLQAETLQQLEPEEWPALALHPVPSLRLLAPSSASDHNRRSLLDGKTTALEPAESFDLRVWRRGLRVFQKRIDRFERAALTHITAGTTFSDLCAWISSERPEADPSELAVGLLQTWLADELLAHPTNPRHD